jgi:uncharacterized protein (TIRG00374 family)
VISEVEIIMNNYSIRNKVIITIIISVIFYSIFAFYSDISKIKENYEQIRLVYLAPILGILFFTTFLRSLIQRSLLKRIGIELSIKQSYGIFLSGLSMLVTPGGSGQAIKSHFIERKYGHPISKSLPIAFIERFYDFLAITIIIFMTIFFYYSTISLTIVIISSIILGCIIIAVKNKKFQSILQFIIRKIPFLNKRSFQIFLFNDSLEKLFESKLIVKTCFFITNIFFIEGFVIYLSFLTFNINLGYLQTIHIFYTSLLAGTLSFLPAGIGILEGTFSKLLIQNNLELSTILSLIIFIRITTTWYLTGLGFIASHIITSRIKKN